MASEGFWIREEQVCGWEELRGGRLKPGSEDVKETVSGESYQLCPKHLFFSAPSVLVITAQISKSLKS